VSLLELHEVTKRFGGVVANRKVSFAVGAAEIVGLIGPNGAGKTTVFNCVAGYYPPSAGRILFEGRDLAGEPPEACAQHGIGRTFQIARSFASMTACENVLTAALLKTKRVDVARAQAARWLDFVRLRALADKPAASMTVSEQRRLAVARALAIEPRLLLMDEVMAGLNPAEVAEVVDVVLQIRELGIACLIVEHVLEGIMPIADRIVVLDRGEKIADGTPAQVSADAAVIDAYLGTDA